MNDINFYDPSLRYRHDWTSTGTALALLAATAVVVMAITLAVRHESKGLQAAAADGATATRSRKEILAVLEARYNQLKTDATLERRLLLLQSTLAHRRADLNLLDGAALHETGGYSTTLLALARQSVDGLWLTGIAMDHGNMTLRGRTVRPDLIAVYVGRLNAEPALHGQAFRELDIRRCGANGGAPRGDTGDRHGAAARALRRVLIDRRPRERRRKRDRPPR